MAGGVTVVELAVVIVGIVTVTEHHQDPAASAERLWAPAVAGISPDR